MVQFAPLTGDTVLFDEPEAPLSPEIAALLSPDKIGPADGAGKTVVVAMSGGVDSAVTALIMRERGYRVVGMNLRLFSPDDPVQVANPCCGIPAMDDARATCALLGIPFYAVNMESEFGEAVVDRFVTNTRPGARRIPAWSATGTSSFAIWSTGQNCSAPIAWRPGTTPGSSWASPAPASRTASTGRSTGARIRATSCTR